jgi:hypothetical protein
MNPPPLSSFLSPLNLLLSKAVLVDERRKQRVEVEE